MTNKSTTIELFRFLFMLIIVFWHYEPCYGAMFHGYIAVEFYFILSGILLYSSYIRHQEWTAFEFTYRKIKRFYPKYLLSLILCYSLQLFSVLHNGIELDKRLFVKTMIVECSFLQALPFGLVGFNSPCWYLSVLLIVGLVLFGLLRINEKMCTHYIFPIFCIGGYLIILCQVDGLNQFCGSVFPLIRGLAGMSMGCVIARFVAGKISQSVARWILIISPFAVGFIIFSLFYQNFSDLFNLVLVVIVILLCVSYPDPGIFDNNRKLIGTLGSISFEMLLFHMTFVYISCGIGRVLGFSQLWTGFLYLFSVLSFSFLINCIFLKFNHR